MVSALTCHDALSHSKKRKNKMLRYYCESSCSSLYFNCKHKSTSCLWGVSEVRQFTSPSKRAHIPSVLMRGVEMRKTTSQHFALISSYMCLLPTLSALGKLGRKGVLEVKDRTEAALPSFLQQDVSSLSDKLTWGAA